MDSPAVKCLILVVLAEIPEGLQGGGGGFPEGRICPK